MQGSQDAPESEGSMATAVVEFNALADPVGAASQNEDLGVCGGRALALAIIRAVHVGCAGLKLGCAGVHPLHGGHHTL